MKKTPENEKNLPSSWVGRINMIKISILPKAIYRFNAMSIKFPAKYFTNHKRTILGFMLKSKKPREYITILKEKTSEGIIIFDLIFYYRATVLKTALYWHKNREDQWNWIKGPDINSHIFEHLILTKNKKNQMEKESIFTKWCWFTWISSTGRR